MVMAGAYQDIQANLEIQKNIDPKQAIFDGIMAHVPANFLQGAAFELPGAVGEAAGAAFRGRPSTETEPAQQRPEVAPQPETPQEEPGQAQAREHQAPPAAE